MALIQIEKGVVEQPDLSFEEAVAACMKIKLPSPNN